MDFRKYQYIVTVAEQKSISKAAKQLYISQPALTKYINKLEDELGIKLFDRTITPIRLTYAGERYLTEIKRILNIKNHLDKEMEEICNMRKGRLTLGIGSARGAFWLPYVLPPFLQEYPGIDVRIVEGINSYFEEQMLKGIIDFSLCALPVFSSEIDYEIITEERILIVVPRGHPLLEGMDVSKNSLRNLLYIEPRKLNGQRFISLAPGQGLYRTTQQLFERHGIKPESIMEITNSDTAFRLSAAGVGITVTPECSAIYPSSPVQPVYCSVDNPPFTRKLVAAYKKEGCLSLPARKFIDMAKEIVTTCPDLQIPRDMH